MLDIRSVRALARAVGVSVDELQKLADSVETLYAVTSLRKSSGGKRTIAKPGPRLKQVQRAIDRRVLRLLSVSPVAYGGVPKRSHLDGARKHVGASAVASVDIKDFFPSVSHHRVYGFFVRAGCSPNVGRLLTRLLTWRGGLPQGSPASPTLANLILGPVDELLVSLESGGDLVATRFVDDIALSGPSDKVRRAVPSVVREINRQGLRLNYRKSEVQTNGGRQQVTNLNVNRKLGLPRVGGSGKRVLSLKDLRDAVRRAERYGLRKKEEESLRGRLRYLRQLDPRRGQLLLARLDAATRDASKTNDERAV